MTSPQVRAIVGARVSHVQGAEKTSHLDQHATGAKYVAAQGWEMVGAFEDLDVSALSTSPWDRPDLGPWLKDKSHEWDALVVAKTDRLFRSAKDSVDLADWAEKHKKILVFADDGIKVDFYHPQKEQDPWSQMMAKIFLLLSSIFAELEGRRFVQRAESRVRFLKNTDRWGYGMPPYGFQVVDHPSGKGKALAHDIEAQNTLRQITEWLLNGEPEPWSLTKIVTELIKQGVPSPQDRIRIRGGMEPRGSKWSVGKLKHILTSQATQGVKLVDGHPALDEEGKAIRVGEPSFGAATWDHIQHEIAERAQAPKTRRHSPNPLLGTGKCGKCGRNLRQRLRESGHRTYVCSGQPKACPGVAFHADSADELVEAEFLAKCGELPALRRVYQPGVDHGYELKEVERTIEAIREDRKLGLFSGPEDEKRYREQMTALIGRRDALASMPVQAAGWVYEPTGDTYAGMWAEAGAERRRRLLTDAGVTFTVNAPNDWALYVPEDILDRMKAASHKD